MSTPTGRPKYYAEYHSNINALALSVQVPAVGVTCIVGPEAIDLIPSNQGQQEATAKHERLLAPNTILPMRTTLDPASAQSSLMTLKIAVQPFSSNGQSPSSTLSSLKSSELPPAPLPASELQGLQNLTCVCCDQLLLIKQEEDVTSSIRGPIQRVVDLPSEHWQELVDCWMCHEEDFTELREGDLGARQGQALVGGTYVLIHSQDVESSAVVIEEDAKVIDWTRGIKRRWRPLACSRCLHPIGDGWYQSRLEDGTDLEMIQVKFHKYFVQYVGQTKDTLKQLSVPRQQFTSYLAAEIFEAARHHATYRFILQDRVQGREMLLLWMLNWDSTIMTNQEPVQDGAIAWDGSLQAHFSAPTGGKRTRGKKVMKVLYLGRAAEDDSKQEALWDRWRSDPGVERLEFQERLVLGLMTLLEQSSSCLPPSQSGASAVLSMDNMRVGSFDI